LLVGAAVGGAVVGWSKVEIGGIGGITI